MLSHVKLFATPWTVAHQDPLSLGFSRQEYWSGLPCPPPGNLPHPGTEPTSPVSSALQVDSLPTLPPWKPLKESSGEYKICIQITIIRADKRNHKLPYGQISVLRHCQRKETVFRRRGEVRRCAEASGALGW